jgi:enediyne biosynthesis protein E4
MWNQLLRKGCTIALIFMSQALSHAQPATALFKLLPASTTSIHFSNNITENDTLNILHQANIYNGGGTGIGDFNNDGLVDIYFAGNMTPNRLYLNKSTMKFEDVTDAAGVNGSGRWCTGVSVVDINADGWLDIYVATSFVKDARNRTNLLYINQGADKNGIPHFKDSARAYGLADDGFSTQGYFFDYDRDGDLDMYLVTNALYDPKTPIRFRPKVTDGSAQNTDRLYRNNGNSTFTNVSAQAGIVIEGWGHAAAISDFNNDGWPDIYVANDFVSNDVLYINNRNGTFTNKIADYLKHTAWNAMGTDVVDINNDGWVDILSLEMLPEDNLRKKRMLSGNEYYNYFNAAQYNYEHQYVRNVLQLNSGNTPAGHPVFSDVGFISGIYQTDWSWCPLVADFDNDGFRDIIITNGLPRDVTDLDYIAYDNKQGGGAANLSLAMAHSLPVVNIPDYAFRNTGGISFENTTKAWGLDTAAFSNGGVYADLDNDGDLDFVVNNINSYAFVYENTLNSAGRKAISSLSISLAGEGLNTNGTGARIHLFYGGKQQYYEHYPWRGYLSTMDNRIHFGLGTATVIDSLRIIWPDGRTELLKNIPASEPLTLRSAKASRLPYTPKRSTSLLRTATKEYGIHYKPAERDFIDYNIQATLPHKLSQYGPGLAVGDIDNNGFDDFYIGGSSGNPGLFFMQDATGKFRIDSSRITRRVNELEEEMGVLFFDADNDNDLDLYAVTGSYEIPPGNAVAQDRLFINNGKGIFELSIAALPVEVTNGSCVRAADFDRDGDLDLFVGGRVVSGAYPSNPKNFLLRNNKGKFEDVTPELCPELENAGMVTDALFTDFDNDGRIDLVLTAEWSPILFFKNSGNSFAPATANSGISSQNGWWNSIVSGDFDNDGDIDYVAGNLGLNSNYTASDAEPMTILAKDVDMNGSLDAMLFCYMKAEDGSRKSFPMHAKDDLVSQVVSIRKKYPTYTSYGKATIDDLWPAADRRDAIVKTANYMQSAYIENKGNGSFAMRPLPMAAQTAPLFGMIADDVNEDGNLDLLLVGNDFGMEPYSGRHDAFNGLYLAGDGKGNFQSLSVAESGLFAKGDAKAFAKVHTARKQDVFIATQNQDSLLVFAKNKPANTNTSWVKLKPDDFSADIVYRDGRKQRVEFYYGSTYLSQSSRYLELRSTIQSVVVTNFKGIKRKIR